VSASIDSSFSSIDRKRAGQRKFVWYSDTDFQMFLYLLMHAFGVVVFLIWFLYVAISGPKFGSQPNCNDRVKFAVLYVFNVRATVPWFRALMIAFFVVVIPFFLMILGFFIIAPARLMKACERRIENVLKKYSWLGVFRYVFGFP